MLRYAKAKLRNIIYYRLVIEPTEPERFRCQYMHVLRRFRKDTVQLLKETDRDDPDWEFLNKAVSLIDPKVRTEDCLETIKELSKLYGEQGETQA